MKYPWRFQNGQGFTLLEVLLALSVIAIAFTALVKATHQNILFTERLQEKKIQHWIAAQGAASIQLGLISFPPTHEITEVNEVLGQRWYWRASRQQTNMPFLQEIKISLSKKQAGPFSNVLTFFINKNEHESFK